MTNQVGRTAFAVAAGVVADVLADVLAIVLADVLADVLAIVLAILVVAGPTLAAAAPRAPSEPERVPASIFARGPDGGFLMGAPTATPDGGAEDPAPPGAIRGSLDKEIIRRVIRGHINDVKVCYEPLLIRNPWAAGKFMVRFVVAPSGQVLSPELQTSSMFADKDHAVANCVLLAMKRWQFPKPVGRGPIIISYPFVLTPAPKDIGTGPAKKETLRVGAIDGGFYLYRATNAEGIPANGLIVDTDGGLLLIDAVWSDAQTEAVLKWGETTLKRPWIGAVITHDHPDRDGGIGALLRRRIPVGALDLTAARLAQRGIRAGVSVLLKAADGSRLDARGFELFFPGAGHTRDNLVVWFPGPRILFGGCLIKDNDAADLGFTADADRAAWPASLRRLSDRYANPSITVPGHGEPLAHGYPYAHTLDLLARHAAHD